MFVGVPDGVTMDDVLFAPVNMLGVEAMAGEAVGGSWVVRGTFSSILADLEEAGQALLALL